MKKQPRAFRMLPALLTKGKNKQLVQERAAARLLEARVRARSQHVLTVLVLLCGLYVALRVALPPLRAQLLSSGLCRTTPSRASVERAAAAAGLASAARLAAAAHNATVAWLCTPLAGPPPLAHFTEAQLAMGH
jgi:hypothetical protein